jgi:ACS family glucarate transporter-like MFS transporter
MLPAVAARSPRRGLLLAFLTTAMFFCYFHRQALSVAAPFMMKDLHLDSGAIGLLLSAFFWSYSFAQAPAGWLIDRYGVGRVYATGFLIWTAAVTLTSIPSSLAALFAIQLFMGIGQGAPFAASARAVSTWFPAGERGGVTGLYLAGNRIGQAAIGAIGPGLIVLFGWRVFFVITGLAGLAWLGPWLFSMKLWEPAEAIAGQAEASNDLSLAQSLRLLRDRRIAGVFLGYFAYDYVWYLLLRWMPLYLTFERKFTPREIAVATSIPFVVSALLIIPSGMLGDLLVVWGWSEVTVRKILITLGLAMGCLIVPAGLVRDNAVSAWLLAGAVCGYGIAGPHTWLLTQAVCARKLVATASGIQNFGGNIGGVISPVLTGIVAHRTGNSVLAFNIAGVILLCGVACYWVLIPRSHTATNARAED